jgi:hypothetical protein
LKIEFRGSQVSAPLGPMEVGFPVLDARLIADTVLVLCDWMTFPKGEPARNLFAYSPIGELLWQAQDIGMGAFDAYTDITSESPLVVFNYACFACTIDLSTGEVTSKQFTK